MPTVDWIAVDWGTSNLRAWGMAGNSVVAEATSDKGMGSLEPSGFEPALLDLISPWLGSGTTPVIACGMVGSRQGWVEAPYASVPAPPPTGSIPAPTTDPRIDVRIVPGLKQATPPDVMRGEETQIAGYLAGNPGFDGVLCLPGTHTKWAQISAGEVVSFRTFMTGELFALLSSASVLRHSTGAGWDGDAFADALSDTMARPESLAARLFSIRADHLLNGTHGAPASARLSGLLIGAELAAARPYWLGQNVAVIGSETQAAIYAQALELQGLRAQKATADDMVRRGLAAALTPQGTH